MHSQHPATPLGWWRHLSPLTRGLWLLLLLNILIVIGLWLSPWQVGDTAIHYAVSFLVGRAGQDSWGMMAAGRDQVLAMPDVPLFSELFFRQHVKFIYPPTSLLVLEAAVRSFGPDFVTGLNAVSWLCLVLTGVATLLLLQAAARAAGNRRLLPTTRGDAHSRVAVVLLLTLTFYPLVRGYHIGQIQTWLTFLAAAALLAWQLGRQKTAGLLLGLVCVVKPQLGIVFLWGLLRKRWGLVFTGLVTVACVSAISVYVYGLSHHTDYLRVLSFLSQRGESFYPNQSMNGLLNRLLFLGDSLNWSTSEYPPFNRLVYTVSTAWSALLLGLCLFWRWRDPAGAGTIELSVAMLSATLASPIAWEHHYGLLLPIFACLVPAALSTRPLGRWTIPWLVASYILVSHWFGFTIHLAPTRLNVLQSHLFFGALMVLFALYRTSARPPTQPPQKPAIPADSARQPTG